MALLAPTGQRSGKLTIPYHAWVVSHSKGGPARAWCVYPEALSRSLGVLWIAAPSLLMAYSGFPISRLETELTPEGLDSYVLN